MNHGLKLKKLMIQKLHN